MVAKPTYRREIPRERAHPLPELRGEALVRALLAEIDEEEALGRSIGVDLTPPGPDPAHAPPVYGPLEVWLQRSEEIHRFCEDVWRSERRARAR
jgi:hypothetical protein